MRLHTTLLAALMFALGLQFGSSAMDLVVDAVSAHPCGVGCVPVIPTRQAAKIMPARLIVASAPKKLLCQIDVWTCGPWEDKCDIYGNVSRPCTLATDCKDVATPPPDSKKRCEKLQCDGLATPKERIACMMSLAPAGREREMEIQYLPEECRAKSNDKDRADCVKIRKAVDPCAAEPTSGERFACVAKLMALGQSISEEAKKCDAYAGQKLVDCKKGLRERAYVAIKFRFDDLSKRAGDLTVNGRLSIADAADFAALVEEKKQAFDAATDDAARRQAILDVRAAWQKLQTLIKAK